MFQVIELLPTGREVIRGTFPTKGIAEAVCFRLNTDYDEENHHFVRAAL